jgi:hypothetical protein
MKPRIGALNDDGDRHVENVKPGETEIDIGHNLDAEIDAYKGKGAADFDEVQSRAEKAGQYKPEKWKQ